MLNIFLTLMPLFSLIVYLIRFNTNNKRHLLTYMLTRLFISMLQSFNLSMFTEEDGTAIATINNANRK